MDHRAQKTGVRFFLIFAAPPYILTFAEIGAFESFNFAERQPYYKIASIACVVHRHTESARTIKMYYVGTREDIIT